MQLLFTGDKGNIKLVDMLLNQRLKFYQIENFFKTQIYPPCLGFVSVFMPGSSWMNVWGYNSFFICDAWHYEHFFENIQKNMPTELAYLHGENLFKRVLDFNLKCQKCKFIYFPKGISDEFVSLVKTKRPDIQVSLF